MRSDENTPVNRSEVARLLVDIDERNRAAQRGLSGPSVVASHESIIARIEQNAPPILQLFKQGRYDDAVSLWEKCVDTM
jgi:hypothetical protein